MALLRAIWMSNLPKPFRWLGRACLLAAIGCGIVIFQISEAASYLSDDPKACTNCHVMFPEYSTWSRSSHARVATCNDCHVPHDSLLHKFWFKANDGARHSTIFTLRLEPQVMKARPEAVEVIQENCLRCHGSLHEAAVTPIGTDFTRLCTDCHRETPHGRVHSLSATPNAAVPESPDTIADWLRKYPKLQ
jgi:cytochrome c nitrite reductase small subunit